MKRLQFMIDEELDAALGAEARSERTSKAALIRRYLAEQLKPLLPLIADPIWLMVGADDLEPNGIDDVVYR